MKEFQISVRVVGEEYYTVNAESFDEAVDMIKKGDVEPDVVETEWDSNFYIESEKDLGDE